MYQGGIKQISLIEQFDITYFHYDSGNENNITDINTRGIRINLGNFNLSSLDHENMMSNLGKEVNEYEVKFYLLGYVEGILEGVKVIHESIFGWALLVEFYDGTSKFYDIHLKSEKGTLSTSEEHSFNIKMSSAVPSTGHIYNYDSNVSLIDVYRADTTILTTDSTIYTADYAQ